MKKHDAFAWGGGAIMAKAVDDAVAALQKDGMLAGISQRYFGEDFSRR